MKETRSIISSADTKTKPKRPRLGHINFINCLPLYYGLVQHNVLLDVELIKEAPRQLKESIINGELDIAPLPSIEYCRNYKDLYILPDLSISSDGAVHSILLVSKLPIQKLDGKQIALTNTSATSQVMLRILLKNKYNIEPIYFETPPDLAQMMREADAALLIGDHALRTMYTQSSLLKYDLGDIWTEHFGHKMVYAVWAVRDKYWHKYPEIVKSVNRALVNSINYSKKHLDEVAEYAARWEIFPVDFLKDYFKSLKFDFTDKYREGLTFYYQKAAEMGFVKEVAPLKYIE